MLFRKPHFVALIGAALVAPGISVALTVVGAGLSAFLLGQSTASALAEGWGVIIAVFVATVWGFPIALAFGVCGVGLAEGGLPSSSTWSWALAGSAASAAYVITALIVWALSMDVGFIVAPWTIVVRPPDHDWIGLSGVIVALLVSGAVAGLTYRTLAKALPKRSPTFNPLRG